MRMPFGRYGPGPRSGEGRLLVDLPLEYLVWMKRKGFPRGRLGALLSTLYEVRAEAGELYSQLRRSLLAEASQGRSENQKS